MLQPIVKRSLHSISLLLGAALAAQVPSWSPDWAVAGLGGTVFSFADYNADLYAGGYWFAAKNGVIRGLARFDGSTWQPVGGGIDLVNYVFPPRNTRVAAMTIFNGELVFSGTFDRVGSQAINYIARWDGTTVRPLGTGLHLTFDEADVRGLAVYNNELYAAGQFDNAGGVAVNGIARWDGTTWRAVGAGLRDSIANTVGYPRCLHVHNGLLVCGGTFDRAGGLVARNVAAWNGSGWSPMGGGSLATVWALESYGTQLVAQGQFQTGANVAMVATWNGASWGPLGNNGPTVPGTTLCAIGTDLWVDEGATLNRYDGTSWSTRGYLSGIFSGFEGTSIRALHRSGTELIVGGEFTSAGTAPNEPAIAAANVVAFDGAAWRGLGTGQGLNRRFDRLLPWRSSWMAAGQFGEAGSAPAVGLARWDGDQWHAFARFGGGLGSGPVYDLAVWQDSLVVMGDFTLIDGQPFPGIARHDGTRWLPFGTRNGTGLHTHGNELYTYGGTSLLRWNGSAFVAVASPPTGIISHLHTHSDGRLYVLTDDVFNHRIMVWDGVQLQQIGSANDLLQAIASYGNEIVVGGRFTAVGGVPAALMARWNGSSWRAMPAPVSGFSANAFAEFDGDLHASISGDPRGNWLRLHNNVWQPLGSIAGVPTTFFVDRAVGSVIGSGDIIAVDDLPVRSVAEWRTQPAWRNRLHGTAGAAGEPLLLGRGPAQAGTSLLWGIEAPPNLIGLLGVGVDRIDVPLFGGLLVPLPVVVLSFATDQAGLASTSVPLPPLFPAGVDVFSQAWMFDPTGPQGFSASNALQCTTR